MNECGFGYIPEIKEKDKRMDFFKEDEGKEEKETETASVYSDSEILHMIEEQKKVGRIPAALFTDIDNTFYRKDRDWSSKVLFRDLQQEKYPIIAVTGNGFSGIEKRIQSGELPYFSIIAGAVGTEIYVLHEENGKKVYKKDEAYEELLLAKDFNRLELAKKSQHIIENLKGENLEYKGAHPEWQLDFQRPEEEKECIEKNIEGGEQFKLSFYAFASSGESLETLKDEILKRFTEQRAVFCEEINYNSKMQEEDINKKYCIDILPTTKADVIEYIADKTGIAFKVIAGDSGNDTGMIMNSKENVSIVVGGAKPELLDVIDQEILNNR